MISSARTAQHPHPAFWLRHLFALLALTALPVFAAIDAPVSPNAQPGVSRLLNFLDGAQGNYIVSGQQERAWDLNGLDFDVNYITTTTGKTPAVRGFDFLNYCYSPSARATQTASERAITWAQNGGIVTFCAHLFISGTWSTDGLPAFYTPGSNGNANGTNFDIRQAVITGTPENIEYLAKLDILATELKKLRDANVTVIWRPFHECGGTWFWWSRYGSAPFITAYRMMFTRFTQQHGLTNLIWVFNPTDSLNTMQTWYPGDDVVDMIALDTYPNSGNPAFATESQAMRNFKAGRKVVAMSECGNIPDPDLLTSSTYWSYFCTWNGFENDATHNTVALLQKAYNHAKVITLDELPALYVPFPLTVTAQPSAVSAVTVGQTLTLSVTVSGLPAPTYQWQRLPAGSGVWANVTNAGNYSGATTATLTLTDIPGSLSGTQFRCVITNRNGTVTSSPGTLTVAQAPAITTPPASQGVLWGDPATFTVAATGAPAPTYQWQKDGAAISGATGSSYTIAGTVGGDAGSYTVVVSNAAGSVTSGAAILSVRPRSADFNADGKPDLIWSNSLTGERALWLMNGTTFIAASTLGVFPLEWTIAATGDFNFDGKPDIVWSNSVTGERALWLMNGTNLLGVSTLGVFPLEWTVAATGDFNFDGKPDIVWSNSVTGERALWLMNGTTFIAASTLGVFPLEWTVAATGDFNFDGKPDIVWSNSVTGERALWLMDGTNFIAASTLGVFPLEWTVAGVGDYNADGKPDLIWSNSVTGERALWLMNGTNFLAASTLGIFPLEWTVGN